jgi:hypothetical protein
MENYDVEQIASGWRVIEDGAPIAECATEQAAIRIMNALSEFSSFEIERLRAALAPFARFRQAIKDFDPDKARPSIAEFDLRTGGLTTAKGQLHSNNDVVKLDYEDFERARLAMAR